MRHTPFHLFPPYDQESSSQDSEHRPTMSGSSRRWLQEPYPQVHRFSHEEYLEYS